MIKLRFVTIQLLLLLAVNFVFGDIKTIPEYDFSLPKKDKSFYNIKQNADNSYKIVGLGDSIMYGVGIDNKSMTYLSLVKSFMRKSLNPEKNVVSVNLGVDGMNTSGLLYTLYYDKYHKIGQADATFDAIQNIIDADLITISIGGNDFLLLVIDCLLNSLKIDMSKIKKSGNPNEQSKAFFAQVKPKDISSVNFKKLLEPDKDGISLIQRSLDKFDNNFELIIQRIRELNNDARIIVITTYNPYYIVRDFKLYKNLAFVVEKAVKNVNAVLKEYAAMGENIYLADITKTFNDYGFFLTDVAKSDPHPNVLGHKAIYETHIRILKESEDYNLLKEKY